MSFLNPKNVPTVTPLNDQIKKYFELLKMEKLDSKNMQPLLSVEKLLPKIFREINSLHCCLGGEKIILGLFDISIA